jgi:hypothetical protein
MWIRSAVQLRPWAPLEIACKILKNLKYSGFFRFCLGTTTYRKSSPLLAWKPTFAIRDRPISPGSPWQNGYVERLIGTVRRECLDRVLIFGEAHLRRILSSYAAYYNGVRPHLALGKDAPLRRRVQRSGVIVAIPILSGLHHHYVRI